MAYKKIEIEGLNQAIEVPADLSDEEALEFINATLASGGFDDLLLETPEAKQDVLSAQEIREPDGLEDPFAVAQAISKRDGIPLSEAREIVAGFPRSSRASLRGESFAPGATFGDVYSAAGRGASAALGDEDALTSMGRVDPNPLNAKGEERGFWPMLGEGILRDPSTMATLPLGGAIASGVSKIAPAALKTGSRLANVGLKGAQGVAQTGADIGFEQATRPTELGSISAEGAALGLLGGGALGGLAGGLTKAGKQATTVKPFTAKTGGEAEKQLQKQFLDKTGLTAKEVANLPKEAQGLLKTITPEEVGTFQKMIVKAEQASRDPLLETPLEEVGRKWVKGEKLITNARSNSGKTMQSIEEKVLKDGLVPSDQIWDSWNKQLNKYGLQITGESGQTTIESMSGRLGGADKGTIAALRDITNELNELGDFIGPQALRDLEQRIGGAVKYGSANRSGIVNTKANAAAKGLKGDIKDLVYDFISENADDATLGVYDTARKNYGKYSEALEEIQKRLGNVQNVGGEEAGSRGAIMTSSMLNRTSNQTFRALAETIESLDPSLNLSRESVMADLAMKAAKTPRGGKKFTIKDKASITRDAIDFIAEKTGVSPADFGSGMLSDIVGATGQRQGKIPKQYLPNAIQYGARPLQKEVSQFIFPFTQSDER